MHAIPDNDSTVLILGYDKGVNVIEGIPIENIDEALSDVNMLTALIFTFFIKRIETWGISENFYQKLNSVGMDEYILEKISYYAPQERKSESYIFHILEILEQATSSQLAS